MKLETKIPAIWTTLLVASVIGIGISTFTMSQNGLQHVAQQEQVTHEGFDGDLIVALSNLMSRRSATVQAEVLTFFHTIRNL